MHKPFLDSLSVPSPFLLLLDVALRYINNNNVLMSSVVGGYNSCSDSYLTFLSLLVVNIITTLPMMHRVQGYRVGQPWLVSFVEVVLSVI